MFARSLRSLPVLLAAVAAGLWAANAQRGSIVLESQNCLKCHAVHATAEGHEPPLLGPDLAGRLVPRYTVPALAAAVWNHTPEMWAEMSAQVIGRPAPSEADWADAFAYLYSLQFAEMAPHVRDGKQVFEQCTACHSRDDVATKWPRITDPPVLAYQMWNHAASMQQEFARRKQAWRKFSGQDFMDLAAYLQNVQGQAPNRWFELPDPATGIEPFREHCASCHNGPAALEVLLANKSFMDIGAAMWNHAELMKPAPAVSAPEMRKIVSYVWELQYLGPKGDSARGARVFDEKGCLSCHRSPATGAAMSPRPGQTFTAYSMVALGWGSGREMHRQMLAKGIAWPSLSPEDVSNLVAYLNTLGR